MHVRAMFQSHPHFSPNPAGDALVNCIDACFDCAQTCIPCADGCLGEKGVPGLSQCIRLNLDCADACAATGSALTRRTHTNPALIRRMTETCAELCRACADECERHAEEHGHCRLCAEACRDCERACAATATSLGATGP